MCYKNQVFHSVPGRTGIRQRGRNDPHVLVQSSDATIGPLRPSSAGVLPALPRYILGTGSGLLTAPVLFPIWLQREGEHANPSSDPRRRCAAVVQYVSIAGIRA